MRGEQRSQTRVSPGQRFQFREKFAISQKVLPAWARPGTTWDERREGKWTQRRLWGDQCGSFHISISYLHSILMSDTISVFRWLAAWWPKDWHCVQCDILTSRFERHPSVHRLFLKMQGQRNQSTQNYKLGTLYAPMDLLLYSHTDHKDIWNLNVLTLNVSINKSSVLLYSHTDHKDIWHLYVLTSNVSINYSSVLLDSHTDHKEIYNPKEAY